MSVCRVKLLDHRVLDAKALESGKSSHCAGSHQAQVRSKGHEGPGEITTPVLFVLLGLRLDESKRIRSIARLVGLPTTYGLAISDITSESIVQLVECELLTTHQSRVVDVAVLEVDVVPLDVVHLLVGKMTREINLESLEKGGHFLRLVWSKELRLDFHLQINLLQHFVLFYVSSLAIST